jgi:hypothetical protein
MVPQTIKHFSSFHVQAEFKCVLIIDFLEIRTNGKSLAPHVDKEYSAFELSRKCRNKTIGL